LDEALTEVHFTLKWNFCYSTAEEISSDISMIPKYGQPFRLQTQELSFTLS